MKILRSYTFKWWQLGVYKLAAISFGLAAASTWPSVFMRLELILWFIFVVSFVYIVYAWLTKKI